VAPVLELRDMTKSSGVEFAYDNGRSTNHHVILESLGGGLGLFDFDGDGRWDLFCPGGGRFTPEEKIVGLPSALFRNLGDWHFEPVAELAGVDKAPYYTHGVSAADFNSDGFVDFVVSGYGGLQLFQNQGDGRFIEVRSEAGLMDDSWSTSAAWGDMNGDGHLDLFVPHYVDWSLDPAHNPRCPGPTPQVPEICSPRKFNALPDIIYYSNGDGTFRDATQEAGLIDDPSIGGKGLGCVLGDVDNDGDLDIYIANDTDGNNLYLNDGHGRLEQVALLYGVACDQNGKPQGSMGIDLGDYNNDGRPDLFTANFEQEAFALYRNEGGSHFLYVSQPTGITALGKLYVGFGAVFADVDRDGDEDFVVSNGHVINFPKVAPIKQEPLVLLNTDGRFQKAAFPAGSYFALPHRGRGLAVADLDDDGDLDFVFSHNDGEPNALVSNEIANDNGWLQVRLVGTVSNRDAIGARLVLHTSAGDQMRQIKGGRSYLSQCDLRAFWGVGKGVAIKALTIHWPSGRVQKLPLSQGNQTLTFVEPARVEPASAPSDGEDALRAP
jgi:hypothetical protein